MELSDKVGGATCIYSVTVCVIMVNNGILKSGYHDICYFSRSTWKMTILTPTKTLTPANLTKVDEANYKLGGAQGPITTWGQTRSWWGSHLNRKLRPWT